METATATAQRAKPRGRPFVPGAPRIQAGPGRKVKTDELRQLERMTRQQAQIALEGLVGPALKVLHRALKGKDQTLALRAAVDVIDRTQGKALQRIEGTVGVEAVTQVSPEMLKLAAQRLLAASATDIEARP